ncbi:MAG: hypothetical protein ACYCQJ_07685 [Nitrososphaerales archaeon]
MKRKSLADLQIENLERLEELEKYNERLIDANSNLLSRIIDYCKKNSIPFDNGLVVLLHEARKALKNPEIDLSPELKRSHFSPEDEREPNNYIRARNN